MEKTLFIRGGGTLAVYRIEKIFHGTAQLGNKIFLLYKSRVHFKDQTRIIFAKKLKAESTFQEIGGFSSKNPSKLSVLEELLSLELQQNQKDKEKAYFAHCMKYFLSNDSWQRMHAFQEWRYFTKKYSQLLTYEVYLKLKKIYHKIPDLIIKKRLARDLSLLRRTIPHTHKNKQKMERQLLLLQISEARKILQQTSVKKKIQALNFLYYFPCKQTREILIEALRDPSIHIRSLAAFYLGCHRYKYCVADLLRAIRKENSLRVKKNIIFALGQMRAKEAKREIQQYAEIPYLRNVVKNALKEID